MILNVETCSVDMSMKWFEKVEEGEVHTICSFYASGKEIFIRYGLTVDEEGGITPYSVEHETNIPLDCMKEIGSERGDQVLVDGCPLVVRPVLNYRYFYMLCDQSIVKVKSNEPQVLDPRPHDIYRCSMCSGKNNLHKRVPIVIVRCSISKRDWIFHWNIAPQDYNGHFLIVPDINVKEQQRAQFLLKEDIDDLLDLMIHEDHSLNNENQGFIGYNSIGAGASQNHIHCHGYATPSPLFSFIFPDFHPFYSSSDHHLRMTHRKGFHSRTCECHVLHIQWTHDIHRSAEIAPQVERLLMTIVDAKMPFNVVLGNTSIFIFLRRFVRDI